MKKKKKKRSAASLKNLVPGGNLRHGAYAFRRTGKIPEEYADIGEEAERFRRNLRKEYTILGNVVLNIVQSVPIRQLVSDSVFYDLLITHLWRQASNENIGAVMASSAWSDWFAASNRIGRLFRQLNRNLKDFC